MPVNLAAPTHLLPVAGVTLGTAQAGIRKLGRRDLCVLMFEPGTQVAGVFTRNRFCAAPVLLCREHLAAATHAGGIRALVVNTGCANAGTGAQGLDDARATCAELARLLALKPTQVLPFSTGVILEPLPMPRLLAGLPQAVSQARDDAWAEAAEAIMTTDTVPKAASRQVQIAGTTVTLTGVAKGAGMIHPNMATMLGFITTDANLSAEALTELCRTTADLSFNCITVDGDTSTNDSYIVAATGKAAHPRIERLDSADGRALLDATLALARELAQAIVRDGEGATKFISIAVQEARDVAEARRVAFAIAHSPLVKTAFFASDPNLGRILAAIGYAGVEDLDVSRVDLYLGDVHVASMGARHAHYNEVDGQRVMREAEINVRVGLGGRGTASATVWTCDLSHDYVSINADYRS